MFSTVLTFISNLFYLWNSHISVFILFTVIYWLTFTFKYLFLFLSFFSLPLFVKKKHLAVNGMTIKTFLFFFGRNEIDYTYTPTEESVHALCTHHRTFIAASEHVSTWYHHACRCVLHVSSMEWLNPDFPFNVSVCRRSAFQVIGCLIHELYELKS